MITVVGLDGSALAPAAAAALAAAPVVVGSPRQLRLAGAADRPHRPLGDPRALADLPAGAVVLASGDPGFFGVVRALRAAGHALRVLPAVSSVALAFARRGLAWDDALVVSAHGRPLGPVLAACRAHPKVAVLTGPGAGPAEIGAALAGSGREIVAFENLGMDDERESTLTHPGAAARVWRDPSVVLVLDPATAAPTGLGWCWPRTRSGGWALADDEFEHRDKMVTKAEVRALALARLAPAVGVQVWDIGCGSGSVAVECARFGAAVVAVDRDPDAVAVTGRNAGRHQVRVTTVLGTAPAALAALPAPDAVFLGGGGRALGAIVTAAAAARRIVIALATLERVGEATAALAAQGYATDGVLLSAARLAPLGAGHRLAPTNPTFLLTGSRP